MNASEWRRLERRALQAHDRESLATLRRLAGPFDVIVEPSAAGIVRFLGKDRQFLLASLLVPASLHGAQVELEAAGRYARCWWVRVSAGGRPVTLLGSHLRIAPLDSPAGGEWILVPCKQGSPSVTSPG